MRTPSRCSACPSSSPMMPVPTTATDDGRSRHSNTSSFTTTRSANRSNGGGTQGRLPVASTTERAEIRVWSSTSSTPGASKRARPRTRWASGSASVDATTRPANRSRSRRTRSITATPSTRTDSACTPKRLASRAWRAASAAAISSLLGMHPTRAHVVPYGPSSTSTQLRPSSAAALRAFKPAVPAPTIATSTPISFTKHPTVP